MATRRAASVASLLVVSVIFIAGMLASETTVNNSVPTTNPKSTEVFLGHGFDGFKYSSVVSPRTTDEYILGKNETATIRTNGTDVLHIDGPGGWTGQRFSTMVYNLFENRSFVRNSGFSDSYVVGGKTLPQDWTNSTTNPTKLKPIYDTANRWVYIVGYKSQGNDYSPGDNANWTQTIYVNRSSVQGAQLQFKIWKAGTNSTALNVTVYVNSKSIWTRTHTLLQTSSQTVSINLTTAQLPSLPGKAVVTLQLSNPNGGNNVPGSDRYVYFDDVYLYLNCRPFSESVDLKLWSGLDYFPVVGSQFGEGTVSLGLSSAPPYDFTFTSNSTGVRLRCNSTVGVSRESLSDAVTASIVKSPSNAYYNVSKFSYLDSTTKTVSSTKYFRDFLNISIPHDWNYFDGVILPNGTVRQLITGLIEKVENGSYSWIIMINVTAIGSYRPNPYIVQAHSTNYMGSVSTYRSDAGIWNATDVYSAGTRIKINSTVQGQASKGSAYVVFYFASNYSVYLNMSNHPTAPDSGGVVSFDFLWSPKPNTNATRPDLWTLVLWNNGTSVAGNWARIKFDLDPPQVRISSLTGRVYVSPTGGTYGAGNVTVGIVAPDAYPKNMTLLVGGAPVKTWNYSTSATYKWNTTIDGNFTLKLIGYDQFDQYNETSRYVYVDNTAPSAPSLIYPNLSDVLNVNTPTLSWGTSLDGSGSGTSTYTLYLDTSPSFDSGNLRILPNLVNPNYTVPSGQPLSATTWWWRVCAVDHIGNLGANSSSRSFTISPSAVKIWVLPDTNVIARSSGTFVAGSIRLGVYVKDTLIRNASLLAQQQGTWYVLKVWGNPPVELNVTYSLDTKVNLNSGFVNLVLRDVNTFNSTKEVTVTVFVDDVGPSPPTLSYPNDGDSINVTNPTLIWGASSDADGVGVQYYILQLDTNQFFNSSNLRTISNIVANSYTVSRNESLSVGTWYWRTRAVDYLGNIGNYSVSRSFQVILAPPSQGISLLLILGVAGILPTVTILSSVVLLKRRRKTEDETFDRKSLVAAYVFSKDGRCMFAHEFKEVKIEPQLLSGFLTAISNMMKEVVGGSGRALRTIERPDAKILLEFGDTVTGALVANKVSREYRRRLKAFLNRFEHDFADKISGWDGRDVFGDASEIVEEVFPSKVKVATYPTIVGIEDLLVDKKIGSVAISVAGKTGSGKSTFCLRHAASLLKRGHPVIIVDGSIPPKDVRKELTTSGVNVDKLEEEGLLILFDAYSEISGVESKEKHKLGSPGELNTINLSLSRILNKLKNATVFFDSLTAMIEYSDLELAVDFIRTMKVKLQQGEHTAFFIIDSNAHDTSTLNYINHVMDGEIETAARRTKKGETERLVSFKRLNGFQIKTGYHQIQ